MVELEPGQTVDNRYLLLEHIGDGGMGSLFKARELELERVVALKFLRPLGEFQEHRFEREAKALSDLHHRNIVTFYRFGICHPQIPYIAMEYCEGESLRNLIQNRQNLTVSESLEIATVISEAMLCAHRQNILHRDLKPENVLLPLSRDFGQLKVVDFGLAKVLAGDPGQQLTATGQLIGSFPYMSPEQCKGGTVDVRSDIYGLACVLFEMLTGGPPFSGNYPTALLHQHINEAPTRLSKVKPDGDFSDSLEAVLQKALRKDPADRYQTMDDFRQDLERLRDRRESEISAVLVKRKNPVFVKCIVVAMALVVSTTLVLFLSPRAIKTNPVEQASAHKQIRTSPENSLRRAYVFLEQQSGLSRKGRQFVLEQVRSLTTDVIEAGHHSAPDMLAMQAYFLRGQSYEERGSLTINIEQNAALAKRDYLRSIEFATTGNGVYRLAWIPYVRLANGATLAGDQKTAEKYFSKALDAFRSKQELRRDAPLILKGGFDKFTELDLERKLVNAAYSSGDSSACKRGEALVDRWMDALPEREDKFSAYQDFVFWLADLYDRDHETKKRDALLSRMAVQLKALTNDAKFSRSHFYTALAYRNFCYGQITEGKANCLRAINSARNPDGSLSRTAAHPYSVLSSLYAAECDRKMAAVNALESLRLLQKTPPADNATRTDEELKRERQYLEYASLNGDVTATGKTRSLFEKWILLLPDDLDTEWVTCGAWLCRKYYQEGQLSDRDTILEQLRQGAGHMSGTTLFELYARLGAIGLEQHQFSQSEIDWQEALKVATLARNFQECLVCHCALAKIASHRSEEKSAGEYWSLAKADYKLAEQVNWPGWSALSLLVIEDRELRSAYLAGNLAAAAESKRLFERWTSLLPQSLNGSWMDCGVWISHLYQLEGNIQERDRILRRLEQQLTLNLATARKDRTPRNAAPNKLRIWLVTVCEMRLTLACQYCKFGLVDLAMRQARLAAEEYGGIHAEPHPYQVVVDHLDELIGCCEGHSIEQQELQKMREHLIKIGEV